MKITTQETLPLPRTGYRSVDYREAKPSAIATYKPAPDPIKRTLIDVDGQSVVQEQSLTMPSFQPEVLAAAYASDSYVRRSVDEYVTLIGKEGWDIIGTDPKAVEYLKLRLRLLPFTFAKRWTFDKIRTMLELCLVLYNNAFLTTLPFKGKTPVPGLKLKPVGNNAPIGALRPLHPALLQPTLRAGEIQKWDYILAGETLATFKPEQVIHITVGAHPETLFGHPYLLASIEDVRQYRQLEWQEVMLVNRLLHPLIHVIVGITPDGKPILGVDPDIEGADQRLREMSADGILITGPDTKIDVHGMRDVVMDTSKIMASWRKRVFGGIRMPETLVDASAGNRSSADAMTAEMHDGVGMLQRTLADAFNTYIFVPMLLEGGFDPITNPDIAHFIYHSVALDEDIKKKDQALQEWLVGGITETELRRALGRNPLSDSERATTYISLYKDTSAAMGAGASADNNNKPTGGAAAKKSQKKVTTKQMLVSTLAQLLLNDDDEEEADA